MVRLGVLLMSFFALIQLPPVNTRGRASLKSSEGCKGIEDARIHKTPRNMSGRFTTLGVTLDDVPPYRSSRPTQP